MFRTFSIALLLATSAAVATPAYADGPIAGRGTAEDHAKYEADRKLILAMAGNYHVTFDMRETTSWRADYTPIPAKMSGGDEVVRVIEDTGRKIVLQHILVIEHEGKTMLVKHWRQDWTYEPADVLVYAGKGKWALETVPERMRKGRWSQTVWQTDDSPRYGGWGEWTDEGGVPRWRSNWTWRPLARRDAVRKPPYDRYLAINRHSPSPTGWIHWQDNIKMGPGSVAADAKIVPFVQESVLNSYVQAGDYNVKAAEDYWAATKDYWAAVRAAWDAAIARGKGVTVIEVADTGSASGQRLMTYADDIQAGKLTSAKAIDQAKAVIAEVTR